jgi:hypothetical protein
MIHPAAVGCKPMFVGCKPMLNSIRLRRIG